MDKIFIKSLHNYYCKNFDTKHPQTKDTSQNRKRVTFTKSSHEALLALNKLVYN